MKKLLPRVALVALGLLLAELSLRALLPHVWRHAVKFGAFTWLTYDPVVGWKNRPGFDHPSFHINRLGLRGPEISREKAAGTLRVVCVGDSRTFGIWQDSGRSRFDNDYPAALRAIIEREVGAGPVEVLNAGVVGYTSSHGLRQLTTQLLDLAPDALVVGFGVNEYGMQWNASLRCPEPRQRAARELLYHAHGLGIFQLGLAAAQGVGALRAGKHSEPWVSPEDYARDLRRFSEICRERQIHLLLLSQALRPSRRDRVAADAGNESTGDYLPPNAGLPAGFYRQYAAYQQVLRRVAARERIELADAEAAFAKHPGEPLFGPDDAVHANPAGARVIADTIHERLRELGWLPAPPR